MTLSPSNPDSAHDAWPLLVQSGARTLFYDSRGVSVYPAALAGPPELAARLEEGEVTLARGRSLEFDPRWSPTQPEAVEFLSMVAARARQAGGLRLHAYIGEDLPLEALRGPDAREPGDLACEFPILRISQTPAGAGPFRGRRAGDLEASSTEASSIKAPAIGAPSPSGESAPDSILIYDNPLGQELPGARAEARRALEFLGPERVRFVGRPLGESEWQAEFDAARIVLYFGHGKNVSGLPAIPGPADWLPFVPAGAAGDRFLVFNACLDGGTGGLRTPGHFCLYPVCPISDRPTDFVLNFLRFWRETGDAHRAFTAAAREDAAADDIRRFVFRMQGFARSGPVP